jgi:hypothetical protein
MLQRRNGSEVFRSDHGLRNREIELSLNAEHQVDHVHRRQADIDQERFRVNFGGDRVLDQDRSHECNNPVPNIGVAAWHFQFIADGGKELMSPKSNYSR